MNLHGANAAFPCCFLSRLQPNATHNLPHHMHPSLAAGVQADVTRLVEAGGGAALDAQAQQEVAQAASVSAQLTVRRAWVGLGCGGILLLLGRWRGSSFEGRPEQQGQHMLPHVSQTRFSNTLLALPALPAQAHVEELTSADHTTKCAVLQCVPSSMLTALAKVQVRATLPCLLCAAQQLLPRLLGVGASVCVLRSSCCSIRCCGRLCCLQSGLPCPTAMLTSNGQA